MSLAAIAALLAGCAGPGSGWSRAPDLSVYGSAHAYARIAWEQNVLCDGWSPARASASQEREFGAREAAVRAALAARHGDAALARADRHFVARVPCGDVPDPQWRERYGRQLRMLEIRLGLAGEGEG
jgi:hypothetical protein